MSSHQEVTEYNNSNREDDLLVKGSINMFEEMKDSVQTNITGIGNQPINTGSIAHTSIEEYEEAEEDGEEYLGFETAKKQQQYIGLVQRVMRLMANKILYLEKAASASTQ